MAEEVILNAVSTDTNGTHQVTVANPNLQVEGIGGITGVNNKPRIVISASTDGTNFSYVGTFYDDVFLGTGFNVGVTVKAESKNIDSGQSVTVSLME